MFDRKNAYGVAPAPGKKNAGKEAVAFGNTIRDYRLKAQMDQEQVGRACGLTANTVSNWERGVSRPDLALIPKLCEVLGMPLEVFFGLPSASTLSRTERQIVRDYRLMSEPNRTQLVKMIDAILESQRATRREALRKSYMHLPCHEVGLSAGFGGPMDEEPETHTAFVRVSRKAQHADAIFPVNGRSMEPDYPDGSMVFVQRVAADELTYGDTIACVVAGTPFVKIYEKDGLYSLNHNYKPMRICDDDNMRLIGRVLGPVAEEDLPSKDETDELFEAFADELSDVCGR